MVVLGGLVGQSGWLPFRSHFEHVLDLVHEADVHDTRVRRARRLVRAVQTVYNVPGLPRKLGLNAGSVQSFTTIPLLLAHGTDDAVVDVELGRGTNTLLRQLFSTVTW